MNHGSLFSGIGGFDLPSEELGWKNIFQVEKDSYCRKVLKKNFPNTKLYKDIFQFDGKKYRGTVDIISGGFPCQPFSLAGKRAGKNDNRYLWPEMFRVICQIRPSWVVGENVPGILSMENGTTLDSILSDLESEGYEVQTFLIPACSVQAWHRRDRVWIIAHSKSKQSNVPRLNTALNSRESKQESRNSHEQTSSYDHSKRTQGGIERHVQREFKISWGQNVGGIEDIFARSDIPKPLICRDDDGFSSRVDRLKSLGNAIVPQVAYEIFRMIEQFNVTTP
ncbi:MAG: DNA (cytosine-5-)-methyltransferase [Bacteroidota bacterium]